MNALLFGATGMVGQGVLDACIFTLGVSAAGMTEAADAAVTCDLTVSVATTLARLNPGMTIVYLSGQGTDSTEHGSRTRTSMQRSP